MSARKTAANVGASQYFTGKPCKHGHIAYRYTTSGGCSDCVKSSNGQYGAVGAEAALERRKALKQLQESRFRAFNSDISALKEIAASLVLARFPSLPIESATCDDRPVRREAGTAMYMLRFHGEDFGTLLAFSNSLLSAHKVDVAAARARILNEVLKNPHEAGWEGR